MDPLISPINYISLLPSRSLASVSHQVSFSIFSKESKISIYKDLVDREAGSVQNKVLYLKPLDKIIILNSPSKGIYDYSMNDYKNFLIDKTIFYICSLVDYHKSTIRETLTRITCTSLRLRVIVSSQFDHVSLKKSPAHWDSPKQKEFCQDLHQYFDQGSQKALAKENALVRTKEVQEIFEQINRLNGKLGSLLKAPETPAFINQWPEHTNLLREEVLDLLKLRFKDLYPDLELDINLEHIYPPEHFSWLSKGGKKEMALSSEDFDMLLNLRPKKNKIPKNNEINIPHEVNNLNTPVPESEDLNSPENHDV